jgi:hypothetical protein
VAHGIWIRCGEELFLSALAFRGARLSPRRLPFSQIDAPVVHASRDWVVTVSREFWALRFLRPCALSGIHGTDAPAERRNAEFGS